MWNVNIAGSIIVLKELPHLKSVEYIQIIENYWYFYPIPNFWNDNTVM